MGILNKIAPATAKPLATTRENGAVEAPIAPAAVSVRGGTKGQIGTLHNVLSGGHLSAPMALLSHLIRVATALATIILVMNAEALRVADPTWQPVSTPAPVSKRGKG